MTSDASMSVPCAAPLTVRRPVGTASGAPFTEIVSSDCVSEIGRSTPLIVTGAGTTLAIPVTDAPLKRASPA